MADQVHRNIALNASGTAVELFLGQRRRYCRAQRAQRASRGVRLSYSLHASPPLKYVHSIVVVHGFNSSATGAWRHANGSNWVLERTFWGSLADKLRVITFGYNANAFSDFVTSRIIDHVEKLLEELFYERRLQKVVTSSSSFWRDRDRMKLMSVPGIVL